MKILAIETSCDETAAAVIEDGTKILSNVVVSQIDIFAAYGGVIPEVAARSHLEAILPVIHQALNDANLDKNDLDAIAVTHTPGLMGSLMIGTLTARMLAILWEKPLYPVHHLKSHIYANWLNIRENNEGEEKKQGLSEISSERIRSYGEDERVSPATAGADDAPREKLIRSRQQAHLLRAKDENKDQTYFLYRMSDEATAHTLFPVGNLTKPEVKALAAKHGLDVATKKESMGVCFVGEVGMKDFLREYLDAQPGEIREIETDRVLGFHDSAIFYTIGQRHGLYLGGGLPYYVVKKDLGANIVYVSRNLNHESLWTDQLELEDLHLRNGLTVDDLTKISGLKVRLRHRAPLISAKYEGGKVIFSQEIKRPAAGQSAVLYSGETCLGGGIIAI